MGGGSKGSRCKTLRARAPCANVGIQALFFLIQAFLAFCFLLRARAPSANAGIQALFFYSGFFFYIRDSFFLNAISFSFLQVLLRGIYAKMRMGQQVLALLALLVQKHSARGSRYSVYLLY